MTQRYGYDYANRLMPNIKGDWVKYSDVEQLQKETAEKDRVIEGLVKLQMKLESDIDYLKEQVHKYLVTKTVRGRGQ